MSPPMLPVVSRQKTTSTRGLGALMPRGAADSGVRPRAVAWAVRTAARRKVMARSPRAELVGDILPHQTTHRRGRLCNAGATTRRGLTPRNSIQQFADQVVLRVAVPQVL